MLPGIEPGLISMTALTSAESELFNALTSGKYNNFALLRCELDGKESACIVALNGDKSDAILIRPLAVILTADSPLLEKLTLDAKKLETL